MKALVRLFIGLIGFVLIAVIVIGVMIATLDLNEHKDFIVAKVEETSGRSLTLSGDINHTFYPWFGLELNDVSLSNAPGFGDKPFLHTNYVRFRIKLLPILQNRFEIDTIQIYGAELNLARNKQGVTNWADLAGEPTPQKQETEPAVLSALLLGGVDIRDAQFSWEDQTTDTRYEVMQLNLSTGELVYGEPIDLSLDLNARANKPAISSTAKLTGTIAYQLDEGRIDITPLEFKADLKGPNIPNGETQLNLSTAVAINLQEDTAVIPQLALSTLATEIRGDLNINRLQSPAPSVQAGLTVNGSDLSLLFKAVEIEPLASQLATLADRSFILKTNIDADLERGDIDVPELSVNLLGASLKADIKARNIQSETPGIQGIISATGPDLPTLLQVLGQFEPKDKQQLGPYGKRLATLPAAQKRFSMEAKFDADMKGGDVDVPALSMSALGVNVSGKLLANNMLNNNGTVAGQLSVNGRNISGLLDAIEQPALADAIQSISFEAGVKGSRSNIDLQPFRLTTTVSGDQVGNKPVDIVLSAATNINLEAEQLRLDKFSLQGLGLNIQGNVQAGKILQAPEVNGQVNIAPFNLRRLLGQLNQEIPVTADKKTLTKVALQTGFAGSGSHMSLSGLGFVLDDSNLQGDFSVNNFDKPAIKFGIKVDSINVDRYLPPKQEGKQKKPVTPEAAAGAAAQLPVDTLRKLNVQGSLEIGKFVLSNATLTNVKFGLNGKDGVIKLDPASADLYQGKYTGTIDLNATGNVPRLTINSALTGIQAEPMWNDITGKARLRGTGDFSAALVAIGADTDTMKKTLNGQMSFSFKNGAVKGFNLGKTLRRFKQFIDVGSFAVNDREETDFSELTGNPVAANGIIKLDDLSAKIPGIRLSGKGILADLPQDVINYQAFATVVATSKGQGGKELTELEGITIPVNIKGQLASPNIGIEWGGIVRSLAQKKLTDQILKKLPVGIPGVTQPAEAQTQQDQQQTTVPGQEEQAKDPGQQLEEELKKQAGELLKGIFGK